MSGNLDRKQLFNDFNDSRKKNQNTVQGDVCLVWERIKQEHRNDDNALLRAVDEARTEWKQKRDRSKCSAMSYLKMHLNEKLQNKKRCNQRRNKTKSKKKSNSRRTYFFKKRDKGMMSSKDWEELRKREKTLDELKKSFRGRELSQRRQQNHRNGRKRKIDGLDENTSWLQHSHKRERDSLASCASSLFSFLFSIF